ncbi:Sigma factor RpoE negative regulatory protein RseA [gamma proteobacterium IMCC1989]|nr:Sigma factor RpoE negative regulatory protein RseA [gamma proteobacterium IMCC1989]
MSQTPVKQSLQESLSALLDGEATELEVRRLLKADDEVYTEARSSWSRYQMASSGAKKDTPNIEYRDLSLNISAAIAEEAVHTGTVTVDKSTKAKPSIWSGMGRFAVAASVAGAVIVGVQFAPNTADQHVAESSSVTLPSSSVPSSFAQGLSSDTTISTVSNTVKSQQNSSAERTPINITESTKEQLKQAEEEVNRLMLEHAQNASQNTQQGVLPYARVPETTEK